MRAIRGYKYLGVTRCYAEGMTQKYGTR